MTRVLTAADPVAELLRLAAELDDTTQEVADQPDVTSRLPAVLNAVWALQGTLDALVTALLDEALPRTDVAQRLRRHWSRERQTRACADRALHS